MEKLRNIIIYCGVGMLLLPACQHIMKQEKEETIAERAICDSLSNNRETEKLRWAAEKLLKKAETESCDYLEGWNYLVQSWVNEEKENNKALELLNETKMWDWKRKFPVEYGKLLITEGLVLKKERRYDDALNIFSLTLNLSSGDSKERKQLGKTAFYAMRQMMSLYQLSGQKIKGYDNITALEKTNNSLILPEYKREWLAVRAQLAFSADRDSIAAELLEEADKLSESDKSDRIIFYNLIVGNIRRFIDKDKETCISMLQKAVDVAAEYGDTDKMGMQCIGLLASVYRSNGRYDDGITMCYRILRADGKMVDNACRIRASSELSYFYGTLGNYAKALEWSTKAIEYSRIGGDLMTMGDIYRSRSNWLNQNKSVIEALNCLRQADSCYAAVGNQQAQLFTKMNGGLYRLDIQDSISQGINMLREVVKDENFTKLPLRHQYSTIFELGRGQLQIGDIKDGLKLVQKAARWYDTQKDVEMQNYVYTFLTNFYATHGYVQELAACFPVYITVRDTLFEQEKLRYITSANVEFETAKKNQENQILIAEVNLKKQTIRYYSMFGIAFVLLAIALITWLVMRHRAMRLQQTIEKMRLVAQEEEVHKLLKFQQELNGKNEELRAELEQILFATGMDKKVTRALDTVLAPRLLTEDEEMMFRQTFMRLHPFFVGVLHKHSPALSKNEELLCMLIYIGFSTEDTALALGISRDSVNKTRYRIRKKIELSKEEGLDEWVRTLEENA